MRVQQNGAKSDVFLPAAPRGVKTSSHSVETTYIMRFNYYNIFSIL